MKRNKLYLSLCAALGAAALSGQLALAGENPCVASAKRMAKSCSAETTEEYMATIAKCTSISDDSDRADCKAWAKQERAEARDGCAEQQSARMKVCADLGEYRYEDPLVDEAIAFIDPDDIGPGGYPDNPYVILQSGHTHVLRSEEYDEDDDETSVELIVVHATDEVREIEGVLCRVVVDVAVEPDFDDEEGTWGFEPVEVTDDWIAQDEDANVYYCGEVARNYEEGVLRDLDGSFEAGVDLAEGGFLTLAAPAPGGRHRQEYSLGEAEDVVEYLALAADPGDEDISQAMLDEAYRCTTGGNRCLMTYDYSPLEPEVAEFKYYLEGTGFVLAAAIEDGEINEDAAEWLLCEGDSLEVLDDCGIDEEYGEGAAEELRQELCDLHGGFCDDGE